MPVSQRGPLLLVLLLASLHLSAAHGDAGSANPYGRDCRLPSLAATMSFVTSFLGSTLAVSIPTHITGYTLPTMLQTALLWFATGVGMAYGVAGGTAFFAVMGEAMGERKSSSYLEQHRHIMWRLTLTNWWMLLSALFFVGGSVGLFAAGMSMSHSDWMSFCNAYGAIAASDTAKTCEQQYISQKYLLLGGAFFLLGLETIRFRSFTEFLHSRRSAAREFPASRTVEGADMLKATTRRPDSPAPRINTIRLSTPLSVERLVTDEFGKLPKGKGRTVGRIGRARGRTPREESASEEEHGLLTV